MGGVAVATNRWCAANFVYAPYQDHQLIRITTYSKSGQSKFMIPVVPGIKIPRPTRRAGQCRIWGGVLWTSAELGAFSAFSVWSEIISATPSS